MCSAIVAKITYVEPHPTSRNPMDLVTVDGLINVANRESPLIPRYKAGDFAVVLGKDLLLSEELLKTMDLWNYDKNKGVLEGKGNRTKPRKTADIMSEVALYKVHQVDKSVFIEATNEYIIEKELILRFNGKEKIVIEGEDVSEFLGITEYVKP